MSRDQLSFAQKKDRRMSDNENRACLQDLQATDPRDDKKRIEEAKGGLLRDSYCWVLDHNDFRQWRDGGQDQMLWIKANPGKGKTILLCGIIDELIKSTTYTANVSFFCKATNADINNAAAQPSLISHLREGYDDSGKRRFEGENAWVALSKIFNNILGDPALQSTCLIIDALDECTTGLGQLLQLIVQTSSAYPRVKWIVSSRNWPSIEKGLNQATQKASLCLELNEKSISAAVTVYIRRHLPLGGFDLPGLADISGWEAEEMLTAFPPGLDALYKRMIDQIYNSKNAKLYKNLLAVISTVHRPITLDELASLVDMPPQSSGNYKALAEIVGLYSSLLILRERTISFVHQLAKDFIVGKAMSTILRRDIYKLGAPGFPTDQVERPDLDPLAKNGGSLEALSLLRSISKGILSIAKLDGLLQVRLIQPPLQVYASALVFSPTSGVTRIQCKKEEPEWIIRKPAMADNWSACLQTLESHGYSLASASYDKTIKIWDAATGQCISTLEGHSGVVNSVAWSHDGTQVASASDDETVKIWDAAMGHPSPLFRSWVSSLLIVPHRHPLSAIAWILTATGLHTKAKPCCGYRLSIGQTVQLYLERLCRSAACLAAF
ncbi:WD40 repeat-like protein [Coniochaeta sp. PMI_546]|nr:WD40 repeat-like protein [Coniochaeta sp. PMI_546]